MLLQNYNVYRKTILHATIQKPWNSGEADSKSSGRHFWTLVTVEKILAGEKHRSH